MDFVDELALTFPLSTELGFLFAQLGDVLIQLRNLELIALALNGLTFDFELGQATCDLIELFRYTVALHTEFGGCFVHQVDGLIRKESFADIALRELYGGDTGIILDTYLVMVLVALLQTSQDRDG